MVILLLGCLIFSTVNGASLYSRDSRMFKCWLCKFGIGAIVNRLKTEDIDDSTTISVMQGACKFFKIQTEEVCMGAINVMKREVMTVLRELDLDSEEVCAILPPYQRDCFVQRSPWNRVKWTVDVPPELENIPSTPVLSTKGLKILHLSDIHIDLNYAAGSAAVCDKPLCCRDDSVTLYKSTSIGWKKHVSAGYWFTPQVYACDIPHYFVDAAFEEMAKEKYDLIYWTGDLPPHNVWKEHTFPEHLHLLKVLADLLAKNFPGTPVHYAIGNHENTPVNSFPVNNQSYTLYNTMARNFQNLAQLDETAFNTFSAKGYYTKLVKPNFRIISVNTNLCNNQNFWMLLDPEDPDENLSYLVKILTTAEAAGEKVHILGHIAPGVTPDCIGQWSAAYNKIIRRFAPGTVTGQFFGHNHADLFQIVTAADENKLKIGRPEAIGAHFLAPSLTTFDGGLPAYRIYSTDAQYDIDDFWTYVAVDENLDDREQKPKWKLEYQASEFFGGARPTDLRNFLYRADKQLEVFTKFYHNAFKHVLHLENPQILEGYADAEKCFKSTACRHEFLCRFVEQRSFTDCTLFS